MSTSHSTSAPEAKGGHALRNHVVKGMLLKSHLQRPELGREVGILTQMYFPANPFPLGIFGRLPVTAILSSFETHFLVESLTTSPQKQASVILSETPGRDSESKGGRWRRLPGTVAQAPPLRLLSRYCACQVCVSLPASATGREAAVAAKGAEKEERGGTVSGPRVLRSVGLSPRLRL
jgi:hypothetical protein